MVKDVRNLDILIFDLIQKNIISKVVAYMCTCVILPLVINIANMMIDILKNRQSRLRD